MKISPEPIENTEAPERYVLPDTKEDANPAYTMIAG